MTQGNALRTVELPDLDASKAGVRAAELLVNAAGESVFPYQAPRSATKKARLRCCALPSHCASAVRVKPLPN
jgi:hypothetical protein